MIQSDQTNIVHIALNFSHIREIPINLLFQVLDHPKCQFPSQNDFIEQVIQVSAEKKYSNELLRLLSYIDFSLASYDQLQSLSNIDKEEIYEDLKHFLKIRESEDNYNKRKQFLQNQKKIYVLNSIEYINNEKIFDNAQNMKKDENKQISDIEFKISQIQKEIDEQKNKSIENFNKLQEIINKNNLSSYKTDKDRSKRLEELINQDKEKISELRKDDYKNLRLKQDEKLKQIEDIKQLKSEYVKEYNELEQLEQNYNKAFQAYNKKYKKA